MNVEGSTELLLPSAGPPLAHNDDTYKGLYHYKGKLEFSLLIV